MKKVFAKRSLGQNYLVDPNHRRKIVDAVRKAYRGGTVIEIGPGKGSLTEGLATIAEDLILVEKDENFAEDLKQRFASQKNIRVVCGDFLEWDFSELPAEPSLVVGNLPYNVSTQILIRLLQHMPRFSGLYLMFQKEVATRCVAVSGSKDYGMLSVWARLFSVPRKLFDIPPAAFRPQPKVTSSIVEFLPANLIYDEKEQTFINFVKLLFSQRRKKISSLLRGHVGFNVAAVLADLQLAPLLDCRAEAVPLDAMRKLYQALVANLFSA